MILPTQINGSENIIDTRDPLNAVINFYKAFNNQDMELMADNWHHSNHATMANPLGGIKQGWDEIESVYKNIFYGKARVFVEFYDFELTETNDMFCIVGRERGQLTLDDKTIELKIRTSRVFSKDHNEWKQLHHHGSIDDASLLAEYQNTILNIKS